MNKRNTRMVAILMSVLMVIGAVAGISWVGVLAEDADTYELNEQWTLVPKADVDAQFGSNTCRDVGSRDDENKAINGIGRGTVIKVENVDFGTGKQSIELNLNVSAAAADTQIFIYVGDDSYKASVHVPQVRYLLPVGGYAWVAPLACDLTGITGKQTVYIVGAGDQGKHSSIKGLRFAEAKTDSNVVDYIANPTTWSVTAGKGSYSGALNGATIGGTGAGTNTIVVKDVDFTNVAGIQLIAATGGNNAKSLSLLAGEDTIGSITIQSPNYSFYTFSDPMDLSEKGLTGKKDVTITTSANSFNVLGIRMLVNIPEPTDPDNYTANAESWTLVPKADVDAAFGGNTCRDTGAWKEETAEFTGIGRGTVIKVENVDFGKGREGEKLELSLNVSDAAETTQIFIYVGEDSYKAEVHVPQVRFLLSKTDGQYVWTDPFGCDLSGITGKQTVYIVGAGDQGKHSSVNGLRFVKTENDPTVATYIANPKTWEMGGSTTVYGKAVNGATIGTVGGGEKKFTIKDVDLTGATKMRFFVGSNGGEKNFNIFIDDATESIGTIKTVSSNYGRYVPSAELDLADKNLTGKHNVTVKAQENNFNTLALQLTIDPDAGNTDPEGTYTARVPKWRIVPASEHGFDDRGAAAWNGELGAFTGVGRCTIIEVSDVDFADGYNFMELLLSVPENCHERFINVFIDDYTTGDPAARFYMTKTEEGEFEWQGQFCENFATVTGKHKVYIVGATDNKGFNFDLKGLRLSKVTITPNPEETLYVVNPTEWAVIGGVTGAYIKDPNGCGIGKNNQALLKVTGIDFTDVTGISLLVGCHGNDKAVTFYGKDPVRDFDDPMELATLMLPEGDYAHFVWSDYAKITGKGMTGVHDLYIQSLGANFDYRALRTTKKDLGPAEEESSEESVESVESVESADSESVVGDESSEAEDPADNPDTGAAAAALPVMLALASAAAIPAIRRKRSR